MATTKMKMFNIHEVLKSHFEISHILLMNVIHVHTQDLTELHTNNSNKNASLASHEQDTTKTSYELNTRAGLWTKQGTAYR